MRFSLCDMGMCRCRLIPRATTREPSATITVGVGHRAAQPEPGVPSSPGSGNPLIVAGPDEMMLGKDD